MKNLRYLSFGFLFSVLLIASACNGESNDQDQTTGSGTEEGGETKEAVISQIKKFKVMEKEGEGVVIEEEFFDSEGRKVKDIDYDFTGSGEIVDTEYHAYNESGQKTETRIAYPDGNEEVMTYQYNDNGVLVSTTVQGGEDAGIVSYKYNDKGDLIEENFASPDGTPLHSIRLTLTYDEAGNIVKKVQDKYDAEGNLIENVLTLEMSYDGNGRMTAETMLDAEGNMIEKDEISYNDLGKEAELKEYDGNGLILIETNTYNQAGLLNSTAGMDGEGNVLYTNSFEYDEKGNQTFFWYDDGGDNAYGQRSVITYK